MAQPDDEEEQSYTLVLDGAKERRLAEEKRTSDDKQVKRMRWIMERFEFIGLRRRNIFTVDEAINWWLTYKPRIVATPTDEEL